MSPIFAIIMLPTVLGTRARAASNSAEKTCVAASGTALRAHFARAPSAEVGLAALNGSLELGRHFRLILKPLLQPFPQLLGVFHGEPCDCCFDLCDRAHSGHSSFCEFPLQARRIRDPKRSAESGVPPEPPSRRKGRVGIGCRFRTARGRLPVDSRHRHHARRIHGGAGYPNHQFLPR